jgi:hypothetical protein
MEKYFEETIVKDDIQDIVKSKRREWMQKNGPLMFWIGTGMFVVFLISACLFLELDKELSNKIVQVKSVYVYFNQSVDVNLLLNIEYYAKYFNVDKYLIQTYCGMNDYKVTEPEIKKFAYFISLINQNHDINKCLGIYYNNDSNQMKKFLNLYDSLKK